MSQTNTSTLPPIHTEVAILGAGTAGLYALREVRRAQRSFVLIDPGPLGTVCARVGCMPSKIALHAGAQWHSAQGLAHIGGSGMEHLQLQRSATWQALRQQRDGFADSAANKAREAAGPHLLTGRARFLAPTHLSVQYPDGRVQEVHAQAIVIATGSRPVLPDWLDSVRERVITTDELFELNDLPANIGILGLGAIGLEMGLALARLGVRVTAADVASTVGGMADAVVSEHAVQRFGSEITLWLQTATQLSLSQHGIRMQTQDGRQAEVELLLAALGRRPNVDALGLAAAGFALDARGTPLFDAHTLQMGAHPVFIAGDANASRTLMHEAADEGAMAGFNAARLAANARATPQAFARKTALGIAFSTPDLCSIGARLDALDATRTLIGSASGQGNGRARILGAPDSLLRLYADRADGRLLGAALMAPGGEHLAHLLALAIERGETAASLLRMPFYHPVIEEMLPSALQDLLRQLSHANGPATPPGEALPPGLSAYASERMAERNQGQ